MRSLRITDASVHGSSAPKCAFVVPAALTRRSRVRQRPPSSYNQQLLRVSVPQPVLVRDQKQQRQQRRPRDNCHGNGDDAEPESRGLKAAHVSHVSKTGCSSSSSSSSSSSINTINRSSRNRDIYQSRNRMMAAGKLRKWTDVLRILDHWEEHTGRLDAKTYNVALSALSKSGRWREALATLDRMRAKGVPPDVYSWNGAISACGRAGKWQQALDLLGDMEKEGSDVRPDLFSYNGAIHAVAKAGRWGKALELLASIDTRGLTPDVVSFTSVMSACDRAGEWQRTLDIMDRMLERDIEPNIVSYGTAISACARGGRWQQALSLLEDIPSRGLALNAYAYGSAIHACVVGGERTRALALLQEMMESGVVPDAAAFNAAMTAVDGWAAALRLLEVMKREGVLPNLVTYNSVLSVVARSGREDVALALLNQMRIDGYSPNVVSFNTAIDACVIREKWPEAVELLEVDMPSAKVKPDVISFTSVIHACAGPNGNWEKAYELLDSMWQDTRGAKPNKRTYDLVIQACGHGGEWGLGVALIDDMRDLGIKADVQTFNIAVAACARSGERLAAETLVANMWRSGVTPDEFTYASLVAACGRAKEWKRATEIFDEARYVRRIPPSLQIYGALLSSLAGGERWADVLTYLDRMVADGVAPDAVAINTGVLAAAKLGDGCRALSLLEGDRRRAQGVEHEPKESATGMDGEGDGSGASGRDPSDGAAVHPDKREGHLEWVDIEGRHGGGNWKAVTPGLLNSVLHALDGEGDDAAVLDAVKHGQEKGVFLNASIYRGALKACGNLGDYSRANALLSQMMEENLQPDIVHWNHALRASAASSRWREARKRLQDMQAFNVTPDTFSYSMVLKACSAGLWSGDSWSSESGWGPSEKTSSSHAGEPEDEGQWEHGKGELRQVPLCRGRYAIELLQEMPKKGVRVCGRSFTFAMAACLESHRDTQTATGRKNPPDVDLRLSEAALFLFDQLEEAGETPSASTYALALKACARTANRRRASSLFFALLEASLQASTGDTSGGAQVAPQKAPPMEVRPWHLASAIAAYDAAGDWPGAKKLWGEALSRGVSPRSPGYIAAIAAAVRAGDMTSARRLVEEAQVLKLELGAGMAQIGGEQAAHLWEDARGGTPLEIM